MQGARRTTESGDGSDDGVGRWQAELFRGDGNDFGIKYDAMAQPDESQVHHGVGHP